MKRNKNHEFLKGSRWAGRLLYIFFAFLTFGVVMFGW